MNLTINKTQKTVLLLLISAFLIYFSSSLGLSFFGYALIIPVLSLFISAVSTGSIFFVLLVKKLFFGGAITLGIPTLISTFALNIMFKEDKTRLQSFYDFGLRVFLPLFCIVLFVIHPIGSKAFLYSFYWFIPVVLYLAQRFFKVNFFFTKALTSTFLAHAVGSIIWLYFANLSVEKWMVLIPVVFAERFISACVMSLSFLYIKNLLSLKSLEKRVLKFIGLTYNRP